MFTIGQQVITEFGAGVVTYFSARRIVIDLADGGTINVVTGTPGFDRIKAA